MPVSHDNQPEEHTCRICLETGVPGLRGGDAEYDEATDGMWLEPCRCDGSVRFVHEACLEQWRAEGTYWAAQTSCPQCHFEYLFRDEDAGANASGRPPAPSRRALKDSRSDHWLAYGSIVVVTVTACALIAAWIYPGLPEDTGLNGMSAVAFIAAGFVGFFFISLAWFIAVQLVCCCTDLDPLHLYCFSVRKIERRVGPHGNGSSGWCYCHCGGGDCSGGGDPRTACAMLLCLLVMVAFLVIFFSGFALEEKLSYDTRVFERRQKQHNSKKRVRSLTEAERHLPAVPPRPTANAVIPLPDLNTRRKGSILVAPTAVHMAVNTPLPSSDGSFEEV